MIGYARLAGQGQPNQNGSGPWSHPALSTLWANPSQQWRRAASGQVGVMDNSLLCWHMEVRSKLISLIDHYETVFNNGEVAVGKTDDENCIRL